MKLLLSLWNFPKLASADICQQGFPLLPNKRPELYSGESIPAVKACRSYSWSHWKWTDICRGLYIFFIQMHNNLKSSDIQLGADLLLSNKNTCIRVFQLHQIVILNQSKTTNGGGLVILRSLTPISKKIQYLDWNSCNMQGYLYTNRISNRFHFVIISVYILSKQWALQHQYLLHLCSAPGAPF